MGILSVFVLSTGKWLEKLFENKQIQDWVNAGAIGDLQSLLTSIRSVGFNRIDARILCQVSTDTTKSFSSVLKQSFFDVLTLYYPLDGRVKDNLNVDCKDEGVLFREAQVKCELSDIVINPNPIEFKKFLPCDIDGTHNLTFAIQVNYFTCVGIAIGACISHKIADGTSFIMFMKTWVATARGQTDIYPQFKH
ncbi:hypothetical protein SO802_013035 [Lithocarpus litseifolius]|uniref:Uncharacterized protein n=1 Tax=Lithocarpus litseifolius TaxID=425828 RepID=A0AAW2D5B1_9ROSI